MRRSSNVLRTRICVGLVGLVVLALSAMASPTATAVSRTPGAVGCPESAPALTLSPQYKSSVVQALSSKTDLWGEQAMNQPDGPTYDSVKGYLTPLMYALAPAASGSYLTDSGVYYIPFGQPTSPSTPGHFALHVADGSQIISDASGGRSMGIFVGSTGAERYGECIADLDAPELLDGYLPILETTYRDHDGITYSQESFAAPLPGTNLLASYVKVTAQATASASAHAAVLRFHTCDCNLALSGNRLVSGGSTYLYAAAGSTFSGRNLDYPVDLSDGAPHSAYVVRLNNASATAPDVTVDEATHVAARAQTKGFWDAKLGQGATFSVPEPLVMKAQRALLIQNLLMTWRYSLGNPYQAFYQDSSSAAVGTLGAMGFTDAYKSSLQDLLPLSKGANRRNWEIGEKLWHAADYYELTHDRSLIDANEAAYEAYAADLEAQHAADPNHLLERQQYSSDIKHDVYGLHQIGIALEGLKSMVTVWGDLGRTDLVARFAPLAADLDTSYHAAVRASSVTLDDGSLFTAADLLDNEQPYDQITDSILGGYWNLVAHEGFAAYAYKPGSPEALATLKYLYQHGSRLLGLLRARDSAVDDVYGVEQANFLADNNQADQLVLSLYGKLANGMTQNTFVSGEAENIGPLQTKWPLQTGYCAIGQTPCTPPGPAEGWTPDEYYRAMYLAPNSANNNFFLTILRLMLVHQVTAVTAAGSTPHGLDLAASTPRGWLADGKTISVADVPTAFGTLAYSIHSQLHMNQVSATVAVPNRSVPGTLKLSLRVPDGKELRAVFVNGKPYDHFDSAAETIDLSGLTGTVNVKAIYDAGHRH